MPRLRRTGDWTALGEAIRHARVLAGFTSGREFAQRAGMNQGTYYNLEVGKPVADAKVIQATNALGWEKSRWLEILEGRYVDEEQPDEAPPQVLIDVPYDEWQRLSEEDKQRVRDLITRLAARE